jgi:hypothetical protein
LWAWWTWALQQACHPYHDLSCGTYTDHFSHMNTARLFTEVGADIWRRPLEENGRPLTDAERAALPRDIAIANEDAMRTFDGWPSAKPFLSSWSMNPRFHPPGDMLLTAPVALLYGSSDISFSTANLLLILLFILYVHAPIYLILRRWDGGHLQAPGLLIAAVVYLELIHWALQGFYEGLLVAPLLLCARSLYRRSGTVALFWFSVAALFHFRALFLLPWAIYALYLLVTQREWRVWGRRGQVLASATFVLGLASFVPFVLLWPALTGIEVTAALNPGDPQFQPFKLAPLQVAVVVTVAALASVEAWLDIAVIAWLALMSVVVREAYPWDILTMLAWLLAPIAAGRAASRVRDARVFAVLCLSVVVFHNALAPEWFAKVVGGLAAR